MRWFKALLTILLTIAAAKTAVAQVIDPLTPESARTAEAQSPVAPPATPSGRALTQEDLTAWLDGYMPYALARGNIAGAVVVVVRDGQVLVQKGYGYSDVARRRPVSPDATLFRPGSVSKLFTWTAVMQLVEQGRLDLDRDVNEYLDFRIPPRDGKPITLRDILTHTAGFEESARYTITTRPMALGPLMKNTLPERVFAPGITPAYSNYATALAGYIVERVSGMSFDDYVESRVLRPIGMARSTFRQPLPAQLRPLMSQGYALASGEPKPFEFVGPAPAGSLSATGADMARFMISHLDNGRGLLRPETARQMHNSKLTILPPLNRMALGFYEQNINGRRTIGHGGDTQYFHSDMALFLDERIGIFVSVNSAGSQGASGPLRAALVDGFADRYFPVERSQTGIDPATARQHAGMMAGTYANSRGFKTTFLSFLGLISPVTLGVNAQGGLHAPAVTGLGGEPRRWIEISPFVWRDVESGERIAARVQDGEVVRWSFDTVSPFMMFDRVPWYRDAAWLRPLFFAAFAVVLLTALAWPVGALNRRRYAARLPFQGRRLGVYRSTRGLAWLAVAVLVGWAALIMIGLENLTFLASGITTPLVVLQILSPIVFFGLFGFAAWSLWLTSREKRGWFSKTWAVLLLLAAATLLWVALAFNLIGFGLKF